MIFDEFDIEKDWPFFELSENESYKATNNGMAIPQELLDSRKKDFESFLTQDNFYIKILREDANPCGIILTGVHKNEDVNIGFIYNIYISPAFRKKGFGSLAMKKALEFCKTKNSLKVVLNVGAQNTAAVNMYKTLGFEPKNLSMEITL